MNVRLDDEVYEELRRLAFDTRVSMNAHVGAALKDYLKRMAAQAVTNGE